MSGWSLGVAVHDGRSARRGRRGELEFGEGDARGYIVIVLAGSGPQVVGLVAEQGEVREALGTLAS